MKITAIAPWFGSKRTLAPRIVAELGEHSAYWEPFCGSMAVLLNKNPCSNETVNDLHGDLVNLARVIRDPKMGAALYRRLRRAFFGRPILMDARQQLEGLTADALLDRAEAYFIDSWQSMAGFAGTKNGSKNRRGLCRRFSTLGGSPSVRWMNAVKSIPAWRNRMRGVTIEQDCGINLCERIEDRKGTVIYADPPYFEKTTEYAHDFTIEDHRRLAKALCRFKETRVVVSYYADPQLAELYPGWKTVDCSMAKLTANANKRDEEGRTESPEVLLINGPAYTESDQVLFQE